MKIRFSLVVVVLVFGFTACNAADIPAPMGDWMELAQEAQQFREHPPTTLEEKTRMEKIQMDVARILVQANKPFLDIKGEVVDDQGNPLEGVTMTVERYKAPIMLPGLADAPLQGEVVNSTINGPFEASGKGWWGMEVKFSKDGYIPQSLGINEELTLAQAQEWLVDGIVSPSTTTANGVHLELRKLSPKSPTLQSTGVELIYTGNGGGRYTTFTPYVIDGSARLPRKDYASADEIKSIPDNSFLMEFAMDPANRTFLFDESIPFHLPLSQKITLKFNAKDGGLILFEPRRHFIEQLRDAPEKGYQQEITFTPMTMITSRLITTDPPPTGAFFYFKTAEGKYGKGNIQGVVDPVKKRAEFNVYIYLQTDGSRNVRSG